MPNIASDKILMRRHVFASNYCDRRDFQDVTHTLIVYLETKAFLNEKGIVPTNTS